MIVSATAGGLELDAPAAVSVVDGEEMLATPRIVTVESLTSKCCLQVQNR